MRIKNLVVIALACTTLFTGCATDTEVNIDEKGKYTVKTVQTDKDNYKDEELSEEIASFMSGLSDEEQLNKFLEYKSISKDTFIIKMDSTTKFKKVDKKDDISFSSGTATGGTEYRVFGSTLTVKFTDEVKVTNGTVDETDKTKVVFDLTQNLSNYYASTKADFTMDKEAPVIKGVKEGKVYTKNVTLSCDDKDLKQLTLNGNKIASKHTIKANGTYIATAIDEFGNTTTVLFFVNKDKTKPALYYDVKDSWTSDNPFFFSRRKVDKSGKIRNNSWYGTADIMYVCVTDLTSLETTISEDFREKVQNLQINGVKYSFHESDDISYDTIEKSEAIKGLKSVTVNGKKCKIRKNGTAVFKVREGKTYKVVAVDKAGNKVTKTLKVLKSE